MSQQFQHDVLVIGSGAAGLSLALNLPALVVIVLCYIWIGLTETAAIAVAGDQRASDHGDGCGDVAAHRLKIRSTSSFCWASWKCLSPVEVAAEAAREMTLTSRPPRSSGRCSAMNGHAPWFSGSS